jgi:DNA-binding MarR family transcriptional regulator
MSPPDGLVSLELDKIIHEKARLKILTYLASSQETETGFTELRDALGFSSGNLSVQLKTLENAKYVASEKGYRDNRPYTGIRLTSAGKKALEGYLSELEVIVASLKGVR